MTESIFSQLFEFNDTHDSNLAFNYANIMLCLEKDMMYNIDTGKRVRRSVFNTLKENGKIGEYSDNPTHPVFGDLSDYQDGLGKDIVKFGQELDNLVSDLIFTIEEIGEGLIEFAQALYFISADLLLALKTHPHFRPIMTDRRLWEELIRFSSELNNVKVKIPVYFYIDRFYMDSVLNSEHEYVEYVSSTMSDNEMRKLAIVIAQEQEFGFDTSVVFRQGNKTRTYIVGLEREFGYTIRSQKEDE